MINTLSFDLLAGIQKCPDGFQPFAVKLVGVHVLKDRVAFKITGEGFESRVGDGHNLAPWDAEGTGTKAWLTGKGIKSLRKKMRVSQAAFGKLVGASMAAVLRWEKQVGKLTFRGDTMAKIVALRGVGVQEAQRRLAGMKIKRK